jgi:hypothetical protein
LLRWTRLQTAVVLLVCLAVAVASSLPWLIKPDLQPGAIAPFDAIAPKDVLVQDSTALEQQRSSLVAQSVVQVIDPEQTKLLRQRLEQQLIQLQQVAMSGSAARVGPVNMSRAEQQWLSPTNGAGASGVGFRCSPSGDSHAQPRLGEQLGRESIAPSRQSAAW